MRSLQSSGGSKENREFFLGLAMENFADASVLRIIPFEPLITYLR